MGVITLIPKQISALTLNEVYELAKIRLTKLGTRTIHKLIKDSLGNVYLSIRSPQTSEEVAIKLTPNLSIDKTNIITIVNATRDKNIKKVKKNRTQVCFQNSAECIDCDTANLERIFLGSSELYLCKDRRNRKVIVSDLLSQRFIIGEKLFKDTAGTLTAIAVCNRKECWLILADKYAGIINAYKIPNREWDKITCGLRLCVLYGKEESMAVTPNKIHTIMNGLEPLAECGGTEYYLDKMNGLLVRVTNETVDPLARIKPGVVQCIGEGTLCVASGNNVYMICGTAFMNLYEGSFRNVDCEGGNVIIETDSNKWLVINTDTLNESQINADVCISSNDGIIYCLTKNNWLVSLNPSEATQPVVKVVKDSVDRLGYASIELKPWDKYHKFSITGPVKVINAVPTHDSLIVSLRPKRLGWSGKIYASVHAPAYHYGGVFHIRSSRPRLVNAAIKECMYSKNGRLKDLKSNIRILAEAEALLTSPEIPHILLKSSEIKDAHIVNTAWKQKDNHYVLSLELWGKIETHQQNTSEVEILLKYDDDIYKLGKLTIERSKCKEYPEPESHITIIENSEGIIVKSSLSNAYLRAICLDTSTENYGELLLRSCKPPILIEEIKEDDMFSWIRRKFVSISPQIQLINHRNSREPYKITYQSQTTPTIRIYLPTEPPRPKILLKNIIPENGSTFTFEVLITSQIPLLCFVICGENIIRLNNTSGSVRIPCDILKALNGIYIIGLAPGVHANKPYIGIIDKEKILNLLIHKAIITSRLVAKLIER